MATHDYSLANQSGASFRADLNNCLSAVLSNNSNATAPSTTVAYMLWADTSNGILKIRNSANNAWVELFQLDGTLTMEDGVEATPGLAFRDDLNTGIWSSAADTFNISTAGTERLELGAATVFNEGGNDVDFRIEGDGDANLFYVDAGNDHCGVGIATPRCKFEVYDSTVSAAYVPGTLSTWRVLQIRNNIESTSGSACGIAFGGDTSDTETAGIVGISDNTTGGVNQLAFLTSTGNDSKERMRITSDGDLCIGGHHTSPIQTYSNADILSIYDTATSSGGIELAGASNSNAASAGEIMFANNNNANQTQWQADSKLVGLIRAELVTSDSNSGDDSGANIVIYAKPEAATSAAKFYFKGNGDFQLDDGNLKVATAGHGIIFSPFDESVSSPGSDSNLLSDYEEGTFTPTLLRWSGSAWVAVSYTTSPTLALGRYIKVGNVVHVAIRVSGFTMSTGVSDYAGLSGLPETSGSSDPVGNFNVVFQNSVFETATATSFWVTAGSTSSTSNRYGDGNTSHNTWASGTNKILIMIGHYFTF